MRARRLHGPILVALLWAGLLVAAAAWASGVSDPDELFEPDWVAMSSTLFGGLALFLFGMDQLARGLKAAAGEQMKDVLGRLTRNRVLGALTGAFVTAVLNSSSVTTVLVVGFITAGVMTLAQSIGVILGANVGSTFTAQIIAFKVTAIGLPMFAVGFLSMATGRNDRARYRGEMLMGLGLIFFGMGVMSDGMGPLRTYAPFLDLMTRMEAPLLGILIGAVFTGLVQSSAATMGIAIVMAADGLISLPAGIALSLGANVGTCVTAVLAALGKPVEAVRAAAAPHVLFNVLGVLLWVALIPTMAEWVREISPLYPELSGQARLAAEVPRQIANAHTLFNVANSLFFLPFTSVIASLVVRIIPERPVTERVITRPKYLDRNLLDVPALALQQVRFELGHVGDIVQRMYAKINEALRVRSPAQYEDLAAMDGEVGVLGVEILAYLRELRQRELTDEESEEFVGLMTMANALENMSEVLRSDTTALGRSLAEHDIRASETMRTILGDLYTEVGEALANAIAAVRDEDERAAQATIAAKSEINRHREEALRHQARAIDRGEPEKRLATFRAEMEGVEILKQIYRHARRMAKTALPDKIANRDD